MDVLMNIAKRGDPPSKSRAVDTARDLEDVVYSSIYACASTLASVIVVGLIICVLYHSARELVKASRRVSRFTYISGHQVCSCGRRCISSYPCIIVSVEVEYVPYVTQGRWKHAQIYEDETKFSCKVGIFPFSDQDLGLI